MSGAYPDLWRLYSEMFSACLYFAGAFTTERVQVIVGHAKRKRAFTAKGDDCGVVGLPENDNLYRG